MVRGVLWRRVVPYHNIRFVGPAEDGVHIACRPGSEFRVAPAEYDAFLADVASRSPHLLRCGQRLVAVAA